MDSERSNLLSPYTRPVKHSREYQDESDSERETETDTLLVPSDTETESGLVAETQGVVNMGLQQLRAARGTATRRLRTVKKAWGTFKAKGKAKKPAEANSRRLRPHPLWSVSLSSPQTPSTRRLMINSPLTPDPFTTPSNSHQYRATRPVGTPGTPLTPSGDPLRRSARIAGQTPTPRKEVQARIRRTTPKRIQLSAKSPGQVLRELNSLTLQVGECSVATGVQAFRTMGEGLTQTITKQDSSTKLQVLKPPVKPARPRPSSIKSQGTDPLETKENVLEPKRRLRLRSKQGVLVSQDAPDGRMLTESFFSFTQSP